VNRLSLGVQSFQPGELAFLGRIHDVADVYRAFEAARAAGFGNINLDFMFGLPDQAEAGGAATLDAALALGPEHLSLYSLIVEPNTPLYGWVATGAVSAPDDDNAAAHFELAQARLREAGYVHYEVSNWARGEPGLGRSEPPGLASRHNLVYWRNEEYLGVGPGAHSHLRGPAGPSGARSGRRWGNVRPVDGWLRRVGADLPTEASLEEIDARTAMGETMMLGLRLVREGVPFDRFQALHGEDLRQVFAGPLADLEGWGLLERLPDRVRVTPRGLAVANQVVERFL
jgi:oxygen-independent coproporphyrinogen-3 oxidase